MPPTKYPQMFSLCQKSNHLTLEDLVQVLNLVFFSLCIFELQTYAQTYAQTHRHYRKNGQTDSGSSKSKGRSKILGRKIHDSNTSLTIRIAQKIKILNRSS